jgi:hypothetical protein
MANAAPIPKLLDLHCLCENQIRGITSSRGGEMAESAAVCLEDQNHDLEVDFEVRGHFKERWILRRGTVTQNMRWCYGDIQDATEDAAYGIAILLMLDHTGLPDVERTRKGGGFDYWLGYGDDVPFQRAVRLEASGILDGRESRIRARSKQKVEQTRRSDNSLPTYAVVVEFSAPLAEVTKR